MWNPFLWNFRWTESSKERTEKFLCLAHNNYRELWDEIPKKNNKWVLTWDYSWRIKSLEMELALFPELKTTNKTQFINVFMMTFVRESSCVCKIPIETTTTKEMNPNKIANISYFVLCNIIFIYYCFQILLIFKKLTVIQQNNCCCLILIK